MVSDQSSDMIFFVIGQREFFPVILVVDDLQWADTISIEVLSFLCQSTFDFVRCCTYRSNEVELSHPLHEHLLIPHKNDCFKFELSPLGSYGAKGLISFHPGIAIFTE